MGVYREYRNFIGKFTSQLSRYLNRIDNEMYLSLFFNDMKGFHVYVTMDLTGGIIACDDASRFYMGVKLKFKEFTYDNMVFNSNNEREIVDRIFKSQYGMYSSTSKEVEEIKIVLDNSGYNTSGMSDNEIIRYFKNTVKDYDKVFKDFDKYKVVKNVVNSLINSNVEIRRHTEVFKKIKDTDLIPVAFIDDGMIYIPNSRARRNSRKSGMRAFDSYSVTESFNKCGDLAYTATGNTPISKWIYVDIDNQFIDKTTYDRFNFES